MSVRVVLALVVLSFSAFAAPKKPVVLVTGPAPVTKLLTKELSKKFTPKPLKSLAAMPTTKEVRDVTLPAGAIAVVSAQATGAFITIQVLSGDDGTPLDTITVKGKAAKPPKALPKPQLAALLFAVAQGKAPTAQKAPEPPPEKEPVVATKAEPEPKVEPKKEVVATKKREPEPKREAAPEPKPAPVAEVVEEEPAPRTPSERPAFRASVGPGGFNRSLAWAGNPSTALGSSEMPFSGAVSVDASWYPGAHFTDSFLANLGLFASAEFGLGMASRPSNSPARFSNHASRVRFGALVRLPLGSRFEFLGHLGYSRHELTTSPVAVNDPTALRPNVPDVLFNGFRGGLGLRLRLFGTVELDALGGFHAVANLGELASTRFFPNATAFAVDAGGGLSVELVPHLRLRAGAEWQRYFVTLNPDEAATFQARTASDQYIAATAQLQWVM